MLTPTRSIVVLLLLALWAGTCAAQQPGTVLPSLTLVATDGTRVNTSQIPQHGKWLLFYIQGKCRDCESLLSLVNVKQYPEIAKNAVIVVGGVSADEAAALQGKFPAWAGAAWFADPNRTLAEQLKYTGVPVTSGMNDGAITWTVRGSLSRSRDLNSIFDTWVR